RARAGSAVPQSGTEPGKDRTACVHYPVRGLERCRFRGYHRAISRPNASLACPEHEPALVAWCRPRGLPRHEDDGMLEWMFALLLVFAFGGAEREPGATGTAPSHTPDLERIAVAVEGAESSRGTDRSMWRPKPAGPQGPM